MNRFRLAATGISAVALTAAGTGGLAHAATTPTGIADIRSAHLSPDAPGVDVYLTAFSGGTTTLWVPNEVYGGVSKYIPVKAGLYTVSMRPHGAPATQRPMMTWTLDAKIGKAYTAAAVGSGTARKGAIFDDDLTPPKPGTARVRLIQAASVARTATVVAVNGPVVAKDAAFATATGYAQVAAGTWPLKAIAVSMPSVSTAGSVSVASGSVTSILLLDKRGGGLTLSTILDAAGAAKMPAGAVPAGGGGTAGKFTATGGANAELALQLGGFAVVLLVAGFGVRRVRSDRSPVA